MKVFDQFAFVDRDALALCDGCRVGFDDLARPIDLIRRRREDFVGDRQGPGMNQGLAVETHVQALAGVGKPLVVAQVEMHAVENRQAVCARRQ